MISIDMREHLGKAAVVRCTDGAEESGLRGIQRHTDVGEFLHYRVVYISEDAKRVGGSSCEPPCNLPEKVIGMVAYLLEMRKHVREFFVFPFFRHFPRKRIKTLLQQARKLSGATLTSDAGISGLYNA